MVYMHSISVIMPHLSWDCCRPAVEAMNEFAPQHSRLFKEVRIFCSEAVSVH